MNVLHYTSPHLFTFIKHTLLAVCKTTDSIKERFIKIYSNTSRLNK